MRARGGSSDATGYGAVWRDLSLVRAGATRSLATVRLTAAGMLRGHVTDRTGHPLRGVEVYLQSVVPYVPMEGVFTSYLTLGIDRFRTDAHGRFVIRGVSRRAARLCFEASRTRVTGGSSDRLGYESTCLPDPVALGPGDIRTLPATALAPNPGAVLTGTVRAGGRPVAHQEIYLVHGSLPDLTIVRTDRAGRYRFGGLVTDRYRVCSLNRRAGVRYLFGLPQKCEQVRVTGHRVVTARTLRLTRGGAARGRLLAANGRPVVGATVYVHQVRGGSAFGEATTGRTGRFRVTALRAGRYRACSGLSYAAVDTKGRFRLVGLAPGGHRVCIEHTDTYFDGERCRTGVRVRAGHAVTVDLSVGRLSSIVVRVRDTDGHPLSGANATLLAGCGRYGSCSRYPLFGHGAQVIDTEETMPTGSVRLAGITPGRYAICVHGYFATSPSGSPPAGYADRCTGTTRTVVVRRAQTTKVALTLGEGAVVTRRVTDRTGAPLSNVLVHVGLSAADDYANPFPVDPSFDNQPSLYSRTDANGHYRVRSVVPRGTGHRDRCSRARRRLRHNRRMDDDLARLDRDQLIAEIIRLRMAIRAHRDSSA